jgi:hypothetical protein
VLTVLTVLTVLCGAFLCCAVVAAVLVRMCEAFARSDRARSGRVIVPEWIPLIRTGFGAPEWLPEWERDLNCEPTWRTAAPVTPALPRASLQC